MAEIEQVLEDFGDNAKKLFKNKWFLIAAGGVAVVAVVAAWRKNSAASEVDSTAYEAIGYAGYPTVSGGSEGSYVVDSGYDSSYMESLLGEINSAYGAEMDFLYTELDSVNEALISTTKQNETTLTALERSQAISQMRANSELYNNITDTATKEALHAENLAIAEKWGWVFDSNSGNYYDGNSVVYTTTKQQVAAIEGKTPTTNKVVNSTTPTTNNGGTVSWVNNVDYQAEINKAIMNGASAQEINLLNAQRAAKIAATGVTNANSNYDKNFDYMAAINKAKEIGVDQSVINNLVEMRNNKINGENLKADGSKR